MCHISSPRNEREPLAPRRWRKPALREPPAQAIWQRHSESGARLTTHAPRAHRRAVLRRRTEPAKMALATSYSPSEATTCADTAFLVCLEKRTIRAALDVPAAEASHSSTDQNYTSRRVGDDIARPMAAISESK